MQERSGNNACIALLVDSRTGEEFRICRYSVSMGRDLGNDLVLSLDKTVSRQHASIQFIDRSFYFQDLGSKNGSRLNGRKVSGLNQLKSGDEITVGFTELVFIMIPNSLLDLPVNDKSRTETLVGDSQHAVA